MCEGRLLFAQLMDYLPRAMFGTRVERCQGNCNGKGFACRDRFFAMAYAQFAALDGLRGLQDSLNANRHCLCHVGFRCGVPSRSTLAHADKARPGRICAELAMALMERARKLYANEALAIDLDAGVFAPDSATIDLCPARFPWTPPQQWKAAAKMHALLGLRGDIPDFIVVSGGKTHGVNILDRLPHIPGSYYAMDRGYADFTRPYRPHQCEAFFATRAKRHLRFEAIESRKSGKATGLRCDRGIRLAGPKTRAGYPEYPRRAKCRDPETGRALVFLADDFDLPALMIAEPYRQRWQAGLFFKWIKQHLQVKAFYGYSENAVRTQLWIAVAACCLLAIIKGELEADQGLHEIREILRASIFQKKCP